ncbi:MAG: hypothetical protein DMD82_07035 [Candidatus Rokuibacteriota bacterium]|nr:MAG: hypothetical protein DMD82_07035 [Candidatus Rokubacteria bacterium]
MAVRIILGDTRPESRGVLQPLCDEQGWQLLAVESSFQVLRMLRDTSEIGLVLINPALPGSGVSGRDVARTIKASAQYGALPVMFVLYAGDTAPEGLSVNGVLEIDRSSPGRLLETMRTVMGIGAGDEHPTPADHAALVADAPRAPATVGAAALKAVEPRPAEPAVARRSARIIVADTVETSRAVLQPLFERQGWELIAAESGFQVLRSVRDTEVDLVLINPYLHASGVSGADIARTIKGAPQFRKLPVLFLMHPGQAPPQGGIADGAIEVDAWPAERITGVLNTALGGPADAAVEDTVADGSPTTPAPTAAEPRESAARKPAAAPTVRSAPSSIPAEQFAQFRDEMLGEVRHAVDTAVGSFVQTVEDALRRLEQHEQTLAEMAGEIAEARRALDAISAQPTAEIGQRDAIEAAVREYVLAEGRSLAEQLVTEAAGAIVPAVAESVVRRHLEQAPNPASVIDELLPQVRERLLEDARHAADVVRPADADVRAAMEGAIRQYVTGEGRSAAEQVIAALAGEIVPAVAERLVRLEISRLPTPAGKVDEMLVQIREELLQEGRRAVETLARQYAETDGRATVESVTRQYAATQGVGVAEELLRAVAREIVPTVAERLIRDEIARLRREYRLG